MGTIFLRSDSDKWGQGLKWGQSESGDNMLFLLSHQALRFQFIFNLIRLEQEVDSKWNTIQQVSKTHQFKTTLNISVVF